jgi:SanA protein
METNKQSNKKLKNMAWILLFLVFACLMVIIGCNLAVTSAAKGRMYTDPSKIPAKPVALLLGTSPIGRSGNPNQFFLRRIDATVKLYKEKKFSRLIISGANRPEEFNEPEEMKTALVKQGVPDSIMELDGEGFRTINSIVRAKDVYGADSILIISQEFHNERALFLAKHKGIDAVAFNAETTSSRRWRIQMKMRESLARVKAVLEMVMPSSE